MKKEIPYKLLVIFLILLWPLLLGQILGGAGMPVGSMVFSDGACPPGLTEVTVSQGRFIVATPSGGTQAGTLGSAITDLSDFSFTPNGTNAISGLTNLAGVAHQHTGPAGRSTASPQNMRNTLPFGDGGSGGTINVGNAGIVSDATRRGLVSSTTVDPDSIGHTHPGSAFTGTAAATHRSTTAPYIQLRLCER